MQIRPEQTADAPRVRAVNEAAFGSSVEADIIDALRTRSKPFISLVAESDGEIVGHILFSPVSASAGSGVLLMGLGPMSVLPNQQRRGIGSALVRAGLDRCRNMGCSAVVVLGHAEYYPRFGFVPASGYGISSEYDVPDEVFLLIELKPGSLDGKSGRVTYHEAFAGASGDKGQDPGENVFD